MTQVGVLGTYYLLWFIFDLFSHVIIINSIRNVYILSIKCKSIYLSILNLPQSSRCATAVASLRDVADNA